MSANRPDSAPLVSVVVPLYNEEDAIENLAAALEAMGKSLERARFRAEWILVDDGSEDGTAWALSIAFRGRSDVRVVAHERNRGFGAALRTGLDAARGRVLVCFDADVPYAPEDAALLAEAVRGPEDADVATVSPWGSGGGAEGVSAFRVFLSRGASFAYRLALRGRGAGLTCFTASFRAYKIDALRAAPWRADDFLATAEILVGLLKRGCRVIEIPAPLHRRMTGTSKMKVVRTALRHVRLLARTALTP